MKNIFMYATIASGLLASCSNEVTPSVSSVQKELNVSANITGVVNAKSIVTGTTFSTGDKIAVFVAGGTGGTAYVPMLAEYSFSGTDWAAPTASADKIYLSNVVGSVYGFYPAPSKLSGLAASTPLSDASTINVSLPAASTSFVGTDQADYMYAVPTYNSGSGVSNVTDGQKVNLKFKHALAKVSFIINAGQSYTGAGSLTSVSLTKAGTTFDAGTGTMAIKDGALNFPTPVGSISFAGTTTINAYSATIKGAIVSGLVAPRADNTGTTLKLTIDGKDMSVGLPVTLLPTAVGDKWVAGNNYVYTVTVDGTNLTVISVSITDWSDQTVGSVNVN